MRRDPGEVRSVNKRILPLLLAGCLALSGCAALLERSYSVVEPYTDRYWDSGAADTLKAESYQDLVNSLLMLLEQRAEEGVIRLYTEDRERAYELVLAANREVRNETILGSYLLWSLSFSRERGESYDTFTYRIAYRKDAEDLQSIMTLSDRQSLVDLLRLAVREEHEKLTAQFVQDMSREEVEAAVETLWQELCAVEREQAGEPDLILPALPGAAEAPADGGGAPLPEDPPQEEPTPEGTPSGQEEPADTEEPDAPVEYPPCPWRIRFYPDLETVGIVEVLLTEG